MDPHDLDHEHENDHICMIEGAGYDPSAESLDLEYLKKLNVRKDLELQRLRNLLAANNIPWKPEDESSQRAKTGTPESLVSSLTLRLQIAGVVVKNSPKSLPTLTSEVQFMIMGYALKSSSPIIDPFFKLCKDHITEKEQKMSGRDITIGFLGTCKALHDEGIRRIVKSNEFIFTQVAALQNFAKIPVDPRLTIKNITLRVIVRYYDQVAGEKIMDTSYHIEAEELKVKIHPRPTDMIKHPNIEAYCWSQVADFVKALRVPRQTLSSGVSYLLLPNLLSMRIDLVNWCRHIPDPRHQFFNVMRTELGGIVDELMLTGCDAYNSGEEDSADVMLRHLIRDNGLYVDGSAEFISTESGLKRLRGYGRNLEICRPSPVSFSVADPEGGYPPKSKYSPGRTVWRWLSDFYRKPKKWIEFHGRTGFTMDTYEHLVSVGHMEDDGALLDNSHE